MTLSWWSCHKIVSVTFTFTFIYAYTYLFLMRTIANNIKLPMNIPIATPIRTANTAPGGENMNVPCTSKSIACYTKGVWKLTRVSNSSVRLFVFSHPLPLSLSLLLSLALSLALSRSLFLFLSLSLLSTVTVGLSGGSRRPPNRLRICLV